MATKDQPLAPAHLFIAAKAAKEDAYLFNVDQYLTGRRPLHAAVLALRKAYKEADRALQGYRE